MLISVRIIVIPRVNHNSVHKLKTRVKFHADIVPEFEVNTRRLRISCIKFR